MDEGVLAVPLEVALRVFARFWNAVKLRGPDSSELMALLTKEKKRNR